MDWNQKKCKPCEGGVEPISIEDAKNHVSDLDQWTLSGNGSSISKQFLMKNFISAIELINRIAAVSELENHHPDIHLTGYRNLQIDLSTHAISGLSENDFILASKIDHMPKELK